MLPPGWQAAPQLDNGVQVSQAVLESAVPSGGTDWPYGCRWCGRSNGRDEVEFCEQLLGVVHSDCHEENCGACAEILCTEDRCDFQDECDGCYETVCKRHGVTECLC